MRGIAHCEALGGHTIMQDFLSQLEFSPYDIAVLLLCPAGSMLGSFGHAATLLVRSPERIPGMGQPLAPPALDAVARIRWLLLRLLVGGIVGLVCGLFFIGALQESVTTLGKLLVVAIWAGYATPKMWIAQEQAFLTKLDDRIQMALEKQRDTKGAG